MVKEHSKFSAYAENEKPISIKTPSTQRNYDFSRNQIVVSVVLINYNQGHYLEEALNSIINQTYSNI